MLVNFHGFDVQVRDGKTDVSREEMEEKVNNYFGKAYYGETPSTIGLIRAIGATSLEDFAINFLPNEVYGDILNDAVLKLEEATEKLLFGKSTTGAQFALSSIYGWKNKQEIVLKKEGSPYIEASEEELIAMLEKLSDKDEE